MGKAFHCPSRLFFAIFFMNLYMSKHGAFLLFRHLRCIIQSNIKTGDNFCYDRF